MPSSQAICRRNCHRTYIRHPTRAANSVGGVTPLRAVRPEHLYTKWEVKTLRVINLEYPGRSRLLPAHLYARGIAR